MTTFNEISFDVDPEDMDPEDRAETLAEFKETHEENIDAYEDLQSEVEDLESFKEEVSKLEDAGVEVDEVLKFKEELKEKAVEGTPFKPSELADASFSRLMELSGTSVEAGNGDGSGDGSGADESEETESKFSEANPSAVGEISEEEHEESMKFAQESIESTFGASKW